MKFMINPKIAEKLARKYLLNKKTNDGKFFFAHTKGVVSSVKILSKRFHLNVNKMISLAWVHDIGYFLSNSKNHAENSLKLLEEENISLTKDEKDCLLNHGTDKHPFSKEGKIMQIADKISIINEDFLEILLSKKDPTEEVSFVKMMQEKSIDSLNKLKYLGMNKND